MTRVEDLIYDWNSHGGSHRPHGPLQFDDETLRDGLQSPSVRDPDLDQKIELIQLMDELGIQTADLGLPGAGGRPREDILALARHIADNRLKIGANVACRTVVSDIEPVVELSQKAGIPIEVCAFIGSSHIRRYAEDWTLDKMLEHTRAALSFARDHDLPVMYVTEDTSRAHPDTIRALYTEAMELGARRLCVCDTVGYSTPQGTRAVVEFVRELVAEHDPSIGIDWHGHRDRDLGVANDLAAIEAGATRIHGTALGVGERVGNTPMDLLLVNLQLLGWIDRDLSHLSEYCRVVAESTGVPFPKNYPVFGADAFRTGTGVHAAAIIKAEERGDAWLADRVYSSVPASLVGCRQVIEVGPMCGMSNVVHWLKEHGYPPEPELVQAVFDRAKSSSTVLTEAELHEICERATSAA